MLIEFLRQAGRSRRRQQTLRSIAALHVAVLATVPLILSVRHDHRIFSVLAYAHILLGIVEGALVVGWRLAQWPKSRALEPLLLANMTGRQVMAGEQLAGLSALTLISASGVPLLVLLHAIGWLPAFAVLMLPLFGWQWGAVVGFGLAWWSYETKSIRRLGERVTGCLLAVYFILGGLAGENALPMIRSIPLGIGDAIVESLWTVHRNNPFALVYRLELGNDPDVWTGVWTTSLIGIALVIFFLDRSARRLETYYVERHYRPIGECAGGRRGKIGNEPLAWWAVRRVREYAGRVNLYLAVGVAILYSAYLVAGPAWPSGLGTGLFRVFESAGGVASLGTVLVLLAAVPAAYQYGLWDSSKSDRCQRLENLLTTELDGTDFEQASWSASWHRGRGYFYAALMLWMAGAYAGQLSWIQVLLAMAAGWLLIITYFVLGFRALIRTGGGTVVGFFLCVVLPVSVWGLAHMGHASIARWLPPGMVYYAVTDRVGIDLVCLILMGLLAAAVAILRRSLRTFDAEIRRSFEADLLRT